MIKFLLLLWKMEIGLNDLRTIDVKGEMKMIDRDKVIKGLECCVKRNPDDKTRCGECPYEGACLNRLKSDALTLLKAQEPMMIEERADTNTINCPKCGLQFARIGHDKSIYLDMDKEPNYCPECGQAVKWDANNGR